MMNKTPTLAKVMALMTIVLSGEQTPREWLLSQNTVNDSTISSTRHSASQVHMIDSASIYAAVFVHCDAMQPNL